MQDQWGNAITVSDDGKHRSYYRSADGMTIEYPSSYPNVDAAALNSLNGQQPGGS